MISSSKPQSAELDSRWQAHREITDRLTQTRDALSQGVYRLDTIEVRLQLVDDEMQTLESFGVKGVLSSLFGTKAGQLDELRREAEDLQREHQQCEQSVKSLTGQVERLIAELAEYEDVPPGPPAGDADTAKAMPEMSADLRGQLEHALDAAESLVGHLDGKFKLCNRLRNGPHPLGRTGVLMAAGLAACRSSIANGITSDIAGSVSHLCTQIRRLGLNPDIPADGEMLAALARLENYAEGSGNLLAGGTDAWAELEILARGFVSDLEERLAAASR